MKYLLIILLIVSCGKHEQPGIQDYRDSDGDGKPNTLDQNKFIADITENVNVNGTLTFDDGARIKEVHSYGVSSEVNLSEVSKRLLTQNEIASSGWKYTTDYVVLHLKAPGLIELKEEYYYVELNVNAVETNYLSIKYLENNMIIDMGRWVQGQTLKLDKNQLQALLKNESHLALEKIKTPVNNFSYNEKTYKLFFSNGNNAKIFHVSHEFSVEDFIKLYAKDAKPFNAREILYKTLSDEKTWWVRSLKDYKTVVFASEKELYESYLEGFEKRAFTVIRNNGSSGSIQIKKHTEAKVILNISGNKTINTFNLSSTKYEIGRIQSDCKLYFRDAHEAKGDLELNALVQEIVLSANNANVNNQAKMSWTDSTLQIKIDNNDQNIDFSLEDLPSSTYEEVGLYHNKCGQIKNVKLVNHENKLVLNVEALVEKI